MNIRLATQEDTLPVFDMFSSYNGEDLQKLGMAFDRDILMENVQKMIEAGCVMIGLDKNGYIFGAAAGLLSQSLFSKDMIFNSSFFYVHPDWRGKTILFINAVKEFLKKTEATHFIISSPAWSGEPMNRFYHMQGFQKIETHFVKKIERLAA